MRILYLISLFNGEINGGYIYRKAIASGLKNLVGYENLDIVLSELDTSDWGCNVIMRAKSYTSGKDKLKNLLGGNITQRSNQDIADIINLIHRNKYDVVFFGSSENGKLISEIKRHCQVKTITCYNDIVADVIEKKKKEKFSIKMLPLWNAEKNAEGVDAKLTDILTVLHQRDNDLLYKFWKRKASVFLPIALEDRFVPWNYKEAVKLEEPLQILFVGSYNWAVNVEAVKWFCENVMCRLYDYKIQFNIAGFQMEKLLDDGWVQKYKNVGILGTVDDLAEVYRRMDIVVGPIWTGSGMKVKIAEALMHGKEIIGTEEALVGYDELKKNICNSAEEFIERLKGFCSKKPMRYIEEHRKAYENNYSIKGMEERLRYVLDLLENV